MKPKIQIQTDGINSKVLIDKKDVSDQITSVWYTHLAGELPRITFEYLGTDMVLTTRMVPPLPKILEPFYISKQQLIQSGLVTEEQLKTIE